MVAETNNFHVIGMWDGPARVLGFNTENLNKRALVKTNMHFLSELTATNDDETLLHLTADG